MRLLVGDLGEFRGVLEVGAVDAEERRAFLHDVALGDEEVVDRAGDSRGDRRGLLRAHGALGERGVLEDDALPHAADCDERNLRRVRRDGDRHDGQKKKNCFHVETFLGLNKRLEYHFNPSLSTERLPVGSLLTLNSRFFGVFRGDPVLGDVRNSEP